MVYWQRHGPARKLRDRLAQEGHIMALAGCTGPVLDADDMRTAIECLFGDAAGRTLGFTPRGLSPWAGLALALHDARHAVDRVNMAETADGHFADSRPLPAPQK